MTQTMKAWFAVPGPEGAVFELREAPVPAPGPGQVVVAVRAAGTNRGELIRGAQLRAGSPAANPARAGGEFAGEIAALGDGVSGWKAGDRVMGRGAGSYAQYVAASPRALMRIPDGMSWAEAAAIPNVFVTAHDALVTNAAAAPGESVMVTAGPSGVGTAAIQIARHLGGNPVLATTRTPAKAAALRALGAHEVVDTREAGWVRDCHAGDGRPRRRRHHRPRRRPDAGRQHPGARPQGAAGERRPQRGPGGRLRSGRGGAQAREHHRRHLPHAHARRNRSSAASGSRHTCSTRSPRARSSPCSTARSPSNGWPTRTSTC